jgi:hypothetical protein
VQAVRPEKLEIELVVAHGGSATGHGGEKANSGHGEVREVARELREVKAGRLLAKGGRNRESRVSRAEPSSGDHGAGGGEIAQ